MDEVRYCRDMISRMRSVPPEVTGSERFVGTRPKAVSAMTDGSSVNPIDFLVAFLGQFDVTKSAEK